MAARRQCRNQLDFSPHFWPGERECQGLVSIYRGPLLLAYDQRYNQHLCTNTNLTGQSLRIPNRVTRDLLPVPPVQTGSLELEPVPPGRLASALAAPPCPDWPGRAGLVTLPARSPAVYIAPGCRFCQRVTVRLFPGEIRCEVKNQKYFPVLPVIRSFRRDRTNDRQSRHHITGAARRIFGSDAVPSRPGVGLFFLEIIRFTK